MPSMLVLRKHLIQSILNYLFTSRTSRYWTITSYLSKRQQIVRIDGKTSDPIGVTSGTGQKYPIGASLFILLMIDLPFVIKDSHIQSFDDRFGNISGWTWTSMNVSSVINCDWMLLEQKWPHFNVAHSWTTTWLREFRHDIFGWNSWRKYKFQLSLLFQWSSAWLPVNFVLNLFKFSFQPKKIKQISGTKVYLYEQILIIFYSSVKNEKINKFKPLFSSIYTIYS